MKAFAIAIPSSKVSMAGFEELKEELGTATGTQEENLKAAIDALREE